MTDKFKEKNQKIKLLYNNLRKEKLLKKWDKFDNVTVNKQFVILKVITCIVTFFIVLGGAVLSKATLLLMASQLKPNQSRVYCNQHLDVNAEFAATISETERVTWIWMIIFAFSFPEMLTFICSLCTCLLKDWKFPPKAEVFKILVTESLPTIGTAIFLFCVLPEIDVVKGAMLTNAVCLVPSIIELLNTYTVGKHSKNKSPSTIIITIIIAGQISTIVIWPLLSSNKTLWLIPISLFLISCGWWENFVPEDSLLPPIQNFTEKRNQLFNNDKNFVYIFVPIWKCLLFLYTVMVIFLIQEGKTTFFFDNFSEAFQQHNINIFELKSVVGDKLSFDLSEVELTGRKTTVAADLATPLWTFVFNITGSFLCYFFGKFSCKVMIQKSYALPVTLTSPVLIYLLVKICGIYDTNHCAYKDIIPSYLFFNGPSIGTIENIFDDEFTWMWLIWLFTQIWITAYIWSPTEKKFSETEKLFLKPTYDGIFIDQSLALNRRNNREDLDLEGTQWSDWDNHNYGDTKSSFSQNHSVPKIYACATMWHETFDEMVKFLKSILLLDEDQLIKRLATEYFQYDSSRLFKMETHVFFDDAFVRTSVDDEDPSVNQWVVQFSKAVQAATFEINGNSSNVEPPIKCSTPYGGKLEWTLPGSSKLIVHLKDKAKVRNRKRWSQVMYMYYLLDYKITEERNKYSTSLECTAENSYILCLDGDIVFEPKAVHSLLDTLKKNKSLGASCGRIHPIGPGIMMWYQKFDYAVGHWLQRSTEYVFGTVLCIPGCFCLIRAKTLMDDNIMKKFSARPKRPKEFIQYDHGEDRFLSFLLLNKGYKIDFNTESDAYTHAPKNFNELFNQRRRWTPSTFLNTLDLVLSWKKTSRIHENVSKAYLLYQATLLISTIIGPGVTFLMNAGGYSSLFLVDPFSSLLINTVPIIIFVFVCYCCKTDTQLALALIISYIYTFAMIAILFGLIIRIPIDGCLAPTPLSLLLMTGIAFVGGIVHPQEIGCILYLPFYFVFSPTMNIVQAIFSVVNITNISWGTRDITVISEYTKKNVAITKKSQNNDQNSLLTDNNNTNYEGGSWMYDESLAEGKVESISSEETRFWNKLIEHHLHPIEDDKEKEEKNLEKFRNKIALIFFGINIVFVWIIFSLTLNLNSYRFNWPFGVKHTFKYHGKAVGFELTTTYVKLEPVPLVNILFTGMIMSLQFIGMLMYRYKKFCEIISDTSLTNYFSEIPIQDPIQAIKESMRKEVDNRGHDDELYKKQNGRKKTFNKIRSFTELTTKFLKNTFVNNNSKKRNANNDYFDI